MGYTLRIGKKSIDNDYKKVLFKEYLDDGYELEYAEKQSILFATCVKLENHENAPAFGEPTDYENARWPSYSAWAVFCEITEINFLFYENINGVNNFKGGHPGYFYITKEWLSDLNHFIKRFRNKYPNCIASYSTDIDSYDTKISYQKYSKKTEQMPVNFMLCRLEWLEYWCNYAVEKYGEEAIFTNS